MNRADECKRIVGHECFELPTSGRRLENRVASLERDNMLIRDDILYHINRLGVQLSELQESLQPTPPQPAADDAVWHGKDYVFMPEKHIDPNDPEQVRIVASAMPPFMGPQTRKSWADRILTDLRDHLEGGK